IAFVCAGGSTAYSRLESGGGVVGLIMWGYDNKTLLTRRTGHIAGTCPGSLCFWLYSAPIPVGMTSTAAVCYPQASGWCTFTEAWCSLPVSSTASPVDRIATLLRVK